MTPLALELAQDLYSEISIRTFEGFKNQQSACQFFHRLFQEVKYFECTDIWPLVGQLGRSMHESFEEYDRVDQRLAFLPAPWTWIEFEQPSIRDLVEDRSELVNSYIALTPEQIKQIPYCYRTAFIFIGASSTKVAERFWVSYETPHLSGPRIWRIKKRPPLPLVNSGLKPQRSLVHNHDGYIHHFDKPVASIDDFFNYATLSIINSPRIIGQRDHYPHGRAERDRLKKMKLVGKFPLRAWTEILLQVTPKPENRSGDEPVEMHLTGEKCLHYCRTYLRVRLGYLEYVEGHWRGNPALGMKRSRYRVET